MNDLNLSINLEQGDITLSKSKILWKDEKTTNEWKSKNLEDIISRMKGWQLNTFTESYNHKIKNGISLFKKNLLNKKL